MCVCVSSLLRNWVVFVMFVHLIRIQLDNIMIHLLLVWFYVSNSKINNLLEISLINNIYFPLFFIDAMQLEICNRFPPSANKFQEKNNYKWNMVNNNNNKKAQCFWAYSIFMWKWFWLKILTVLSYNMHNNKQIVSLEYSISLGLTAFPPYTKSFVPPT